MFIHLIKYRFLCLLRDKQLIFWTLLFPVLLATLFHFAFSNLNKNEILLTIPIAVVENTAFMEDTALADALKAVSQNATTSGQALFEIQYTDEKKAQNLLKNNKISGYIIRGTGIQIYVNKSGLDETILRSFFNEYLQTSATMMHIIHADPTSLNNGFVAAVQSRNNYLRDQPISRSYPDTTFSYFYALIAMFCLYGSFWGVKEMTDTQANQSAQGARLGIAPVHKLKLLIYDLLAALVIQFSQMLIFLAFLRYVIGVNYGDRLGPILLLCFIGSIVGIGMGSFIGSLITGNEGLKIAIQITVSMVLSFLSGMMYVNMKYIVMTKAPALGYNPATLISDGFYALYTFDSLSRFYTNILWLLAYIILFCSGTYFVVRRQKYASI